MPESPENPVPDERFVSELVLPERATSDVHAMSRGEPGLPRRFYWREHSFEVAQILNRWKTSSRDRGDLYLRRHWFEVVTTSGHRLKLYCQRQAPDQRRAKSRWWLYTIREPRVGSPMLSPPRR